MTNLIDWAAETFGFREKDEKVLRMNGKRIPYLEITTANVPNRPLIIGIHGFGANERQMQSLVNINPDLPHTYIAPRAPFAHPTGGFMWFDIEFNGNEANYDELKVTEAVDLIDAFIEEVIGFYQADPNRVVFIGYSQGGMLAFPYLLRHASRVKAVAALSGSFSEKTASWATNKELTGKELFIGYGIKDPLIQPQEMVKARRYFSERNANVIYKQYPIPHVVSQSEVGDINNWLEKTLSLNEAFA